MEPLSRNGQTFGYKIMKIWSSGPIFLRDEGRNDLGLVEGCMLALVMVLVVRCL